MTTLVTGGCGFLGAYVVDRLLSAGEPVVIFDLAARRTTLQLVLGSERAAAVPIVAGDIRDRPALLRAVNEHQAERIVHLAAALNSVCNADPALGVEVNVGGLTNVFEVQRAAGLRRMVWASSGGVFGGYHTTEVLANDAPYKPRGLYAACKAFGESLAQQYWTAFALDSIALRFPVMAGVGITSSVTAPLFRELIEKPALGQPGVVPCGEDAINSLWAGDAAEAVRLALDAPPTRSRAFNLDGDMRPVSELAEIVRHQIPGAQITLEPKRYGFSGAVDARAAEEELGFRATVRWEEQIRILIAAARRQTEGAR